MTQSERAVLAFALFLARPAGAQQLPDLAPYLMPDRAAEIALARTAGPAQVGDSATVLVMTRTGFVEAVRGTNGFTCVVLRSFSGRIGDPGFWNPRVRAPHCFNLPAAHTVLPSMLKRAEWILGGVPLPEVANRTRQAFAAREFSLPAEGAMAYMISREQYLLDQDPRWMPHLMFYYDKRMPASIWGAGGMTSTVIDASAGEDEIPVRTLLVPVARWSDGTPAAPHAGREGA
jgi:hypothetical protein